MYSSLQKEQFSPAGSGKKRLQQQTAALAKQLFKTIIGGEDLEKYKKMPRGRLLPICKEVSLLFHRKIEKKPNQIIRMLSNYHQIILGYSDSITDSILNNISLHFILLSSYSLISSRNTHLAKEVLKKSVPYLESTNPDPPLLTIAICNLSTLRMQKGKYYKNIPLLIKVIMILQKHLTSLKKQKKKTQFIEDTVIQIHAYLLLAKSLKSVIQINQNQFYKELYLHVQQLGLKKSVKYLGKESLFTKELYKLNNGFSLQLPIYRQAPDESTLYQDKILRQLFNIEQLLKKQSQRAPQTIVVKEQKPPSPPPTPPPPPPPIEEPSEEKYEVDPKKIVGHSTFNFGKWKIDAKIAKQEEQKYGTVILQCIKGKDNVNLIVLEERFIKLLSQMNIEDILPYECSLNNLTANQIIRYCIMEFLFVDQNKNIQVFPRAIGIIKPIVTYIMKKECLVFTYHIRYNSFRLALCPKGSSETYYLDIELHLEHLRKFFDLDEQTEERMENIYGILMEANNSKKKMEMHEIKRMSLLNQEAFQVMIRKILALFIEFLDEHGEDMGQGDIFAKKKEYFKFVQGKSGAGDDVRGIFYYIRYLSHIKGFDIYAASTDQNFTPDGKKKAKGNILYNSVQFQRDFGNSGVLQEIQQFRCFSDLIVKKYGLKVYQQPLTTKDREIYQQNSIVQKKITQKTFLRKMRMEDTQVIPLTACVVNMNNEFPIGLRLTGYNPTTYTEASFFIHIYSEVWRWPEKMEESQEDFIAGAVEEYGYKKDFFLIEWLQRFGFRQIIGMLKVTPQGDFQLKGYSASFLRIAKIIDQIYY